MLSQYELCVLREIEADLEGPPDLAAATSLGVLATSTPPVRQRLARMWWRKS